MHQGQEHKETTALMGSGPYEKERGSMVKNKNNGGGGKGVAGRALGQKEEQRRDNREPMCGYIHFS